MLAHIPQVSLNIHLVLQGHSYISSYYFGGDLDTLIKERWYQLWCNVLNEMYTRLQILGNLDSIFKYPLFKILA